MTYNLALKTIRVRTRSVKLIRIRKTPRKKEAQRVSIKSNHESSHSEPAIKKEPVRKAKIIKIDWQEYKGKDLLWTR
jgi:hypothetical protein